ncbi:hypothetical protein BD413DRAFT_495856 [Trametes elegans]|nr:hypothetical protein BD413DRAFT_495856 [Trametes elegans]
MYNHSIAEARLDLSPVDSDGAEKSSIVFSTCGNECIDDAALDASCDSNDNLKCLCEDTHAQNNAVFCLNKQCSFKDIDTFEDAMDNCPDPDPKGTESTTARTTLVTSTPTTSSVVSIASHTALTTTVTAQPETSITPSSSPEPPLDTTSVDVGDREGSTASPSSGVEPSSSSVSLPSSATSTPLMTSAPSESRHLPSSASASKNTPTNTSTGTSSISSADSSTPSLSSATSPSTSVTATADTHAPSRTAIVSLLAALAVLFLISLLISLFYLRRRHRRTKRLKPSLPQTGSATKEEAPPPPTSEAKHADANSDRTSVQNGPAGVTRASECVDARIAVASPPRMPERAPPASGLFPQRRSAHAEGVPLAQTGTALHALPTSQSVPLAQNSGTVRVATEANATASTGVGDASFTAGDVGSAGEACPAALPAPPESPAKAHVDDSEMHCPPSSLDAGISAEPTLVSPSPPPAFAPSGTVAASPGVSRMRRQRFLTVVMDLSEEDAEAGHPPPYYPRISNEAGAVHASEGEAHCA